MKQFIYLDVDSINSLVAQIDNGIEESYQQTHEKGNSSTDENSTGIEGNIAGGLKIPAVLNLGGTVTGEGREGQKYSENEVFKEIHNKRLHDSIFNRLMEYLVSKNYLNPQPLKSGSFIKGEDSLEIVDFEYLSGLFDKNAFISFLKESQENEIRKAANNQQENFSRDQRRSNESEIKKRVAQLVLENNQQYDDIEKILNALKYLIPYKRMALSTQGFLLPLDDEWFRDVPDLLGFKYGGNITFVGYITNIINSIDNEQGNLNVFASLQMMINKTLFPILSSALKQLYILHPIALYFES